MEKELYPKLSEVRITGGEFGYFSDRIREITLPDVLKKFTAEGALSNYDRVAMGLTEGHVGPPWYHGLICECIRGASDFLAVQYDPEIDKWLDGMIDRIGKAQDADPEGYINPYTTLMIPAGRWGRNGGNIRWQHETYNAGALIEAGIHHYEATGKKTLLRVAVRMADYLADFVGDAPKHNVVCEHSLCEESLLELYRLFEGNEKLSEELGAKPLEYKRVSRFFIDHKGDNETRYTFPKFLQEYAQDHRPAIEQKEAVGHAVRATLFYSSMAAMAYEDGDKDLEKAAKAIWKDITETKFHANGSVGAFPGDEKFGQQYELPNNAYLETCAGVGMIFFGANMAKLTGEASVFDSVESTLYNLLRASVSETFDHYTYENPLETAGGFARWEWHGCPCCPPMLLKAVGFLPRIIYAEDGDSLKVNLYMDSVLKTAESKIEQKNGVLTFLEDCPKTLCLRIPEWARHFRVLVNGKNEEYRTEKGYALVKGAFQKGDTVSVLYDSPIIKYMAHPYVGADKGRVMIKKGPTLYCAESIDNLPYEKWEDLDFEISGKGKLTCERDGTVTGERADGKAFRLIPYYRWNNRGALPMRIWFRQQGYVANPMQTEGWEGKLYRPFEEYYV